jgi:hypothetical protein
MKNERHPSQSRYFGGRIFIVIALTMLTFVLTQQFAHAQNIIVVASTVPGNGDVNPYGIVRVPKTTGALVAGNILVSNFNNSANLQGTGTTIVQIAPDGAATLFAAIDASTLPGACPGGVGLTTALAVLRTGWVIVGSLPTSDGTSATAQAGCLIVLDSNGNVAETFSDSLINGPWDMTALDSGSSAALFVTNALNGTVAAGGKITLGGTVIRLDLTIRSGSMPSLQAITTIGSGFAERTDPGALVIGPTGVALSKDGSTLYVADSLRNRIQAISNPVSRVTTAHLGTTLTHGGSLNDPLGLALAVNGDILAANGNNGYLTEITPAGQQISKTLLDSSGAPPGAGALFGLVDVNSRSLYYVDDATNTLNLLQ